MRGKWKYPIFLSIVAAVSFMFIASFYLNQICDTYAQNQLMNNRICVIIDAGHGGVDGGAISCTGALESHINLEIALRLNDLLHLLGIQTKMIRTEDISVYTEGHTIAAKKVSDLKERVRIVNSTDRAILISIHQNYFSDSRYGGAQVFYQGNDSTLAFSLQQSFLNTLNTSSKRKAKRGEDIYLLKQVRCTTALIECGFLSNPQEEKALRSPEYQRKICCVIGSTLSSYIHSLTTA